MAPALVSWRLRVYGRLRRDVGGILVLRGPAAGWVEPARILTEVMMGRILWFELTLCMLLLMVPTTGWTHAYLVKSSPARRAMLSSTPTRVVLWFNERLEPQFSQLAVWNAEGQRVDVGDLQVGPEDGKKLSVGIPTLPAGIYTVKYRVLSVDGHIVQAEFPFTVRSRR